MEREIQKKKEELEVDKWASKVREAEAESAKMGLKFDEAEQRAI